MSFHAGSTPMRRQFQSCDNCRQRRKKCDAGALGIDSSPVSGQKRQSCSTCTRSARTCTFNWLRQQKLKLAFLPPSTPKRPKKKKTPVQLHASTFSKIASTHTDDPSACAEPTYPQYPNASISMFCSCPSHMSISPVPLAGQPNDLSGLDYHTREQQQDVSVSPSLLYDPWSATDIDWSSLAEPSSIGEPPCIDSGQKLTDFSDPDETPHELLLGMPTTSSYMSTTSPQSSTNPPMISLADDRVAAAVSRRGVTDVLIMVYRSNMEDVLSSWSNSVTCPYVNNEYSLYSSIAQDCSTFYERAKQLDSSLPRMGFENTLDLSISDDYTASQVLNKAVLAFASQWDYSASASGREISCSGDDSLAQQLHLTMHKTLWHDAYVALRDAENLAHSFRVIFANIIFSFIHGPIDTPRELSRQTPCSYESGLATWSHGQSPHIQHELPDYQPLLETQDLCRQLMAGSECSSQLRNASHQLLRWRRLLGTRIRSKKDCGQDDIRHQKSFLVEFNTLFWLGVMCDTTYSAVTGHPLVISDDDCAIDVLSPDSRSLTDKDQYQASFTTAFQYSPDEDPSPPFVTRRTPLWNSLLFRREVGAVNCSFSDLEAEWTLKTAIPIKVLLFRRIAIVQTLIDQFASPHRVENAIQDALLVHQQWQLRYETFMTSCVEEYNNIPHKLRSWHVILTAHWYYGLMLLSTKIQNIDDERLGDGRRADERRKNSTAANLALTSAMNVARLATYGIGVSYPVSPGTPGQESHIMLSEPWCEIMVRSLTTAVETIFRLCSYNRNDQLELNIGDHPTTILKGVESCIQALTEIGTSRYKPAGIIANSLRNSLPFTFLAAADLGTDVI